MYLLSRMYERVVRVGTLRLIDASGRTHVFGDRGQPDVTIWLNEPEGLELSMLEEEVRPQDAALLERVQQCIGRARACT